jgi:transposase
LEVYLVNARGTKNLPGRKSDVQECQWLRKLHTYGLLRNSFRPPEQIRSIRTLWRLRDRWVQEAGRAIQQMQKALTKMNVQLANTISDISGVTGMAILRAILKGVRDPWQLAKLRHRSIAASEAEIAHSLEGHWQEDILFELQQVLEGYDFYQQQIVACNEKLQNWMAVLPSREVGPDRPSESTCARKSQGRRKNHPGFDLAAELRRALGVDVTAVDGVDVITGQVLLTEVGADLSAFPTEDYFAAWLGLTPRRDVSGGKVIRHVKPDGSNRLANALRMAAQSLSRSDSYLGARYRSLRGRLGGPRAIKAMARYLACLLYRLLTRGQAYLDRGAAYYENRRQERERLALERKAAEHGLKLVPLAQS